MKKIIIFDLFATLVQPVYQNISEYEIAGISKQEWETYAEDDQLYVRRATGLLMNPRSIIDEILEKANIHLPERTVQSLLQSRIDRFRRALTHIDPVIIEALNAVKSRGIPMALISNADAIDVMYWAESPLHQYFAKAVFSYEAGFIKPDIRIFHRLLGELHVAASSCLYVGDGGSGEIQAAHSLGMKTVLTTQYSSEHSEIKSDYVISNLHSLLGIIEQEL